ncbi:MAG TPA: NAD(P)/FAD-dependent oxidoreductase [Thermoanaerobaculia bacterium]|nr:NAD(P)/FAD-dependent oxidoreductase [Thermoanaerobaculia bacterium]
MSSGETPLSSDIVYDCIIIGGGPAGLTAAIFLGRYRRKVLLMDTGEPRNYASRGIHGFLGYHEIAPHELRARGRAEAESVGAKLLEARATRVIKSGDCFRVETDGETWNARRVLLAFGVKDAIPALPRFEEFYGKSAFHCPDCDGWEMRDRSIGVIGQGKAVAGLSLKLMQWTDDVTVFTDGCDPEMSREQVSKLQAQGIRVKVDSIAELEGDGGALKAVHLRSGERVECQALFFTLGVSRSCGLAEECGCAVRTGTNDIEVDEHQETSVSGIYAAGDLTFGSQLAIKAAAEGAVAAIAINRSLLPPALRV